MRKNILFYIFIVCISTALVSCDDAVTTEDQSSTTPLPDGATFDTSTSPLYLGVYKKYEKNEVLAFAGECAFSTSDPVGSSKTCTIKIPELELYYSDLIFKVGTSSTTLCDYVVFTPYRFKYSNSATYFPTGGGVVGEDDIDCSSNIDAKCYGGAAPDMMKSDFPKSFGFYLLPAVTHEAEYKLTSSNKRNLTSGTHGNFSFRSNVNAASNLALLDRANDLNNAYVDYVQNTMHDYTLACRDKWANPLYHVTVIITDEDVTVSPYDDAIDYYFDWADPF